MQYEINYLVLQSKTEELENIRQQVKDLIKEVGGEVTIEKKYQKRKLSYEIKHEKYGFYTVLRFEIEKDGEKIVELRKKINLNSAIARYIIVDAAELPSLNLEEVSQTEKVEERKTLKQEELQKVLSESKAKPEPVVAEEKKPEKVEVEEIKEVKEEVVEPVEVQEEAEGEKEEVVEVEVEEEVKVEEKKEETAQPKEKLEEKTEEKQEEKKKETDNRKKEKMSLDDLDKKLDEILDIE